jgi:hypothetical protein
MRTHWIFLLLVLSLAAGSCSPAQTDTEEPPPLAPEDPDLVTPVPADAAAATATAETAAVAPPTTVEAGAWKTYRNTQAGYSVEYPADWMVTEQAGEDGSIVTNFLSVDSGAGFMVLVQNGEFSGGNSDVPNTRCEEVKIGGLVGMRCVDTLNFVTSTTVAANGQTIRIAPLGKRIDEAVYSHLLATFRLI